MTLLHGDIRLASDFEALPAVDWVIDAAANPSVLAGTQSGFSSRQLVEHNLVSVVNVLEYCKAQRAGLLLLSTSRVYSIEALASLPLRAGGDAFHLDCEASIAAPASRLMASEWTSPRARRFPCTAAPNWRPKLWRWNMARLSIFRYGSIAAACWPEPGSSERRIREFSRIGSTRMRARRPLRYIGFDGTGKQVRDLFHPRDLAALVDAQMNASRSNGQRIYTAGGGPANAISLARLNAWCDARFGAHAPAADPRPRRYDIPWVIMDSSDAERDFGWRIETPMERVFEEIAQHAERNPEWLELSAP